MEVRNFNNFFNIISNKKIIINSLILFLIFLIVISDLNIFFAIIFGMILAQFGNKISLSLKKKFKIPRIISSVLIVISFGFIIFSLIYFFAEIVISQGLKLFSILTNKNFLSRKILDFQNLFDNIFDRINFFKRNGGISDSIWSKIEIFFNEIPEILHQKLKLISLSLIEKSYVPGLKLIHLFYFVLLSLIFSFFMMHDWDKIQKIKNKLFGIYSEKIQNYIDLFKNLFSKMLIGQVKVALILFCFYAFSFWILKFEYYLVFSILFAILTLIPILGSLLSVTFLIFSLYILEIPIDHSVKLFIIFGIGYVLENLFLTPKLVGSLLNVHPLIIFIGLILFSKFFGIFGMFFALPIIAFFIKIINNYLEEIQVK